MTTIILNNEFLKIPYNSIVILDYLSILISANCFAHPVKGRYGMQASKHVPVMLLYDDRVLSALVQMPEMDQFNLDFPVSLSYYYGHSITTGILCITLRSYYCGKPFAITMRNMLSTITTMLHTLLLPAPTIHVSIECEQYNPHNVLDILRNYQ